MPRYSKLSPELIGKVCKRICNGDTRGEAAASVGCHRDTLYEWVQRGERALRAADATDADVPEGEALYAAFALRYRKAEAQYTRRMRRGLRDDPKGWSRFEYLLKVFAPDEYGTRQVLEHTGPKGGPIEVNATVARDKLLAKLAKKPGPGGAG